MHPVDQPQVIEIRRATDPPTLWISLVAGSVLLHLLFLIGVSLSLMRTARVPLADEPIAVEFVEPRADTTQAGGTALTRGTASKAALAPRASVRATAQPRAAAQVPALRSVEPQAPIAPNAPIVPLPQVQPSPLVRRSPKNTPARSNTPLLTKPRANPDLDRPPLPAVPPQNSGSAISNPAGEPERSVPPGNSGGFNNGTTSSGNLPNGNTSSGGGSPGEPSLPGVSVSSRRGSGTGLKLTVSNVTSGNAGKDVVDQLARPQTTSQTFSSVPYPAIVGLNLGRSIKLLVRVKSDGTVESATVQNASFDAVPEYNDFASNLVKGLTFEPSLQAGKPVTSQILLDVRLDPIP